MKILVFGATGGTGSRVVTQSLEKGFDVTAFVRNPSKEKVKEPRLKVVQGNVLDSSSIDKIMHQYDAVICCLGTSATKPGTLRSEGTKNIIASMQRAGISRLICQSSLGFGDSKPVLQHTPFFFRKIIVPYLLKKTFEEHQQQENYVRQSNLDWTIIRPGSLTNGKRTAKYRQDFDYSDGSLKVKISRADVAHYIVSQLENHSGRRTVSLSY